MCANLQGYPHSPLKKARCRKKRQNTDSVTQFLCILRQIYIYMYRNFPGGHIRHVKMVISGKRGVNNFFFTP